MNSIRISRTARLPDPLRISRYFKAPELGPDILFFSGGSALNGVSRVLKKHTYNSTHLITPFDSGGSSAKLRQAFDMPAIGDLRSRLIDAIRLFFLQRPMRLPKKINGDDCCGRPDDRQADTVTLR